MAVNLLDMRVNYDITVMKTNVGTNANTVTSINAVSGSACGCVLDFIAPHILRFGIRVRL